MVAISKEEEVQKISTSIFVTNFPNHAKVKDLWNVCKQYGQVVDAFIPDIKSKAGGHTPGSDEDNMTLKELTDLCTTLLQKVLDLEKVKTAQAKEIASLSRRKVYKQGRKNLKSQQMFQDNVLDKDADTDMIVEDNGNGEKGGSTTETVSTTRPEVSTVEPKTPPPTTNLFDDKDVTIANTLIDVDHELAVRLTLEEQEKYTVEERSKLLAEFFERRKKQLAKERAEAIRSKPPTKNSVKELNDELSKLYM
nr:ChaC-like family protein [Tanacetum cinerariifolium]